MTDYQHFFDTHTHSSSKKYAIVQWLEEFLDAPPSYYSVGIHPEIATMKTTFSDRFLEHLQANHCIAVGEIGLDSRYDNQEAQETVYINQLQFAQEHQKPVILHCVNRWDRCRFLHQKYAPNVPLIYHGFNKPGILDNVLEYHMSLIAIGASVLSNTALQHVIKDIPMERLLVETDTSDLDITVIYQQLADLKSLSLREFSTHIFANVQGIFKL